MKGKEMACAAASLRNAVMIYGKNASGSYFRISNSTAIIQYPACAAGYPPAEWYPRSLSGQRCSNGFCRTGSDHMLLVNRRTGRCLDAGNAAGGQPPARAILQQWDCITHTGAWNLGNQSWDIGAPGFKRTD